MPGLFQPGPGLRAGLQHRRYSEPARLGVFRAGGGSGTQLTGARRDWKLFGYRYLACLWMVGEWEFN